MPLTSSQQAQELNDAPQNMVCSGVHRWVSSTSPEDCSLPRLPKPCTWELTANSQGIHNFEALEEFNALKWAQTEPFSVRHQRKIWNDRDTQCVSIIKTSWTCLNLALTSSFAAELRRLLAEFYNVRMRHALSSIGVVTGTLVRLMHAASANEAIHCTRDMLRICLLLSSILLGCTSLFFLHLH